MTIKQKRVALDILENPGKPVSQAMLDAGYSPAHAKNPDDLTKSKGWQQLMNEYLPDEKLLQVAQDGLEAMKPIGASILVDKNGKVIKAEDEGAIEVVDHFVRHKYLETGLKLKKHLGADNNSLTQVNITLPEWSKD